MPKNKNLGNNKETKFVNTGERSLNTSDFSKASTVNLNDTGISARQQLKESESIIFRDTEHENEMQTFACDEDFSLGCDFSPDKEMLFSQLQKDTLFLDLQDGLTNQLKELEESNTDDEEAAKIECQEREREAQDQKIRENEEQLQQKFLEVERQRLTARVDHFKIIYEEIKKQASRVEVDNVQSIKSILKAAKNSALPDQSEQTQDPYTETLSQYVYELEAFTDIKFKLIKSITEKLEIAQKFAKTTVDRQNIELSMTYLAQDKMKEAQQVLDLVENEDLAQEKCNAQIKIDQKIDLIKFQEQAKRFAEEEALRKKIQQEQEQKARELKEAEEKAEAERVAAEQKREEERIQAEKAEAERQASLKAAEAERVAAEQKKADEKIAEEKAEADRKIAAQRAEADRISAERAEAEREAAAAKDQADSVAAAIKVEAERQAALKAQIEEAENIRAKEEARKKEDEAKSVRILEESNSRRADEAFPAANKRKAQEALRESQPLNEQIESHAKIEADYPQQLLQVERQDELRPRAAEQPKREGLSMSTIGMIAGGIVLVGTILKFTLFKNK